ncbi:unnamed protein product [Didymodactylos carnosus]|uniref:Delta(24(24(1)))-sterol reductase n=1 Tax=Didymodactylos carnosus TaxID=1234261 RepID=A0A813NBZ9_9BILA|nr:unnamed protein product [Didymodactylos carnosus]CAF1076352.1 unnamed protein product [Didymodactylos carnosus]CAF3840005.1 unnamed protein product [Didymodactylos carnosus]
MGEPGKEFGGTPGNIGLMIFSHVLPFYFCLSLKYSSGGIYWPSSFADFFIDFKNCCTPTITAFLVYIGFFLIQLFFAAFLPGLKVKGLPVPTENNFQYSYNCNALYSWYLSLILAAVVHITGIFPLTYLANNFGSILCCSVIFSDILSVIIHFYALKTNQTCRMSNEFIYDFFMGVWLNPSIWIANRRVDLKMFAEVRLSWLLLFFLIMSAAVKQYELYGYISLPMIFLLTAQFLYVNAIMKGEECIVTTWDIFYEKWGWMLIYWNLAGVPFVYAFHAYYILENSKENQQNSSVPFILLLFIILFGAYYIWDSAQSQKNRFRAKQRGIYVARNTFPQLPYGTLDNPKYLKTQAGDSLLIDGWWKYARKIHYTADICMAFCWAVSCYQTPGILPYFYPVFFTSMILHRYQRDMERCQQKYGNDWKIYCKKVPYAFIPGLI